MYVRTHGRTYTIATGINNVGVRSRSYSQNSNNAFKKRGGSCLLCLNGSYALCGLSFVRANAEVRMQCN